MADDFKIFVNTLRSNGSDLIFICHDKETTDGDIIKHAPDCTGQSKDLLIRIADQVGYICKENGKRTIRFEPMDNFVGKNVAGLGSLIIPDNTDPNFSTFMAGIIKTVKSSIQNRSEAQRKANDTLKNLREQLTNVTTDEEASALLYMSQSLPQIFKKPFFEEIKKVLSDKGFVYNGKTKRFNLKEKKNETAE